MAMERMGYRPLELDNYIIRIYTKYREVLTCFHTQETCNTKHSSWFIAPVSSAAEEETPRHKNGSLFHLKKCQGGYLLYSLLASNHILTLQENTLDVSCKSLLTLMDKNIISNVISQALWLFIGETPHCCDLYWFRAASELVCVWREISIEICRPLFPMSSSPSVTCLNEDQKSEISSEWKLSTHVDNREKTTHLVEELQKEKEKAVKDARRMAKALYHLQQWKKHHEKNTCQETPSHISFSQLPLKCFLEMFAESDIIFIDSNQPSCIPQVGKRLIPLVLFHLEARKQPVSKFDWYLQRGSCYDLASHEWFYIPTPQDVNCHLVVEWQETDIEKQFKRQRVSLGPIQLSPEIQNLLVTFQLVEKAFFVDIMDKEGISYCLNIDNGMLSAWPVDNGSSSEIQCPLEDVSIELVSELSSLNGFRLNAAYELFTRTRFELHLLYCTVQMFIFYGNNKSYYPIKDNTTDVQAEKPISMTKERKGFFPFSFLRKSMQSNVSHKPINISKPLLESVRHAKEDFTINGSSVVHSPIDTKDTSKQQHQIK